MTDSIVTPVRSSGPAGTRDLVSAPARADRPRRARRGRSSRRPGVVVTLVHTPRMTPLPPQPGPPVPEPPIPMPPQPPQPTPQPTPAPGPIDGA